MIAFTGDGDGTGIGGNHLIHAARNNVDMVVLCINNNIYGMTGGQVAPTTPHEAKTATTPYGNPSNAFDACKLVEGAGATFVARWTTAHLPQLQKTIEKALQHKGFSFIEVMSQCPTQYGRKAGGGNAIEMLGRFKADYSTGAADSKMRLGEFVNIEKPELCEEIDKMVTRASAEKHEISKQKNFTGAKPMHVRIAGKGGQGIVLAGMVLGHAFASCGLNVLQTQSYGSEARGGACKADVIASKEQINDLSPDNPDVLVVMGNEALEKYGKGAPVIIMDDTMTAIPPEGAKVVRVPASKIAKELGSAMSANAGMLGGFAAVSGAVPKKALANSIRETVDARFAELNTKVMEKCFEETEN
jgi:Pyruvate/2-oxoacid:ferredoxin oxidoreductase gamma subunit